MWYFKWRNVHANLLKMIPMSRHVGSGGRSRSFRGSRGLLEHTDKQKERVKRGT